MNHAGGGVDTLIERAQHLVDRARIALDRRLLSRYHMHMSSACVPEITIGEIVVGSSVRL